MNQTTVLQHPTLPVAPYAIGSLAWSAVVGAPMLFVMSNYFSWSTQTLVVATIVLLNATIGLWWMLRGMKMFLGEAASGMSDTLKLAESDPNAAAVPSRGAVEHEWARDQARMYGD